jgi:hypothetical protein
MSYFSPNVNTGGGNAGEKFIWSPVSDSIQSPLSDITSRSEQSRKRGTKNVHRPWRHSISHHHLAHASASPSTTTVRQFNPGKQRLRLFVAAGMSWLVTVFFCLVLGLCLWGFSQLLLMKVWQVKMFNALIVLASLWLGNNLAGSLKDYALMARWRFLAMKARPIREADLLMHCESLRKVLKLLWTARPSSGWGISTTQLGCIVWLSINLALSVLVALLGLTYNIDTSLYPELRYGLVSIADLSTIRDVWGAENPSFSAQLGAANSFGIQGQDYNFTDGPVPGQDGLHVWGSPYTPNIYANEDWTEMRYYFMDLNTENPNLSVLSKRYVAVHGNCTQYPIVSGGNGTNSRITYTDLRTNENVVLDAVRVGPGAVTYISALNSTCGPRCSEIFALQSGGDDIITEPSFFHCNATITPVQGLDYYTSAAANATAAKEYELPDNQARIMAGAIGWTGFNFTADDQYQYVRYTVDSWWSPNNPTNVSQMAGHIMEFAIEAVAALDNNGDRLYTQGWYPVPSQIVNVEWKWAATLLAVIPGLHLLAALLVVSWAGKAIIRDESCISVAKMWRPILGRLGDHGCLLTGDEICEQLGDIKVRYGVMDGLLRSDSRSRENDIAQGLRFENEIVGPHVRHVGMIEENDLAGDESAATGGIRRASIWQKTQVHFPEGLYDGEGYEAEHFENANDERRRSREGSSSTASDGRRAELRHRLRVRRLRRKERS